MDKKAQQFANVIEVTSPGNWQVKAWFGTALIAGLVVLALFFRWQIGIVILILGILTAYRLWVAIQRQKKINVADERLLDAEMGQAEEALEIVKEERQQAHAATQAARLELQRASIAVRLHHFPKVGLLYFHNDGSYDLLRERRSLTARDEAAQLAAEAQPEPQFRPSLIQVMSQSDTVYVIAGAQRSGKTYQAGHIADRWLSLGIPPTVVGPKADNPGWDWTGCNSVIADDKPTIDAALRAIMEDAAARHKLLKEDCKPRPVILDDWIGTLAISKRTAYEFMSMAATTMASAGLVIYFLMQGDTVGAFGLKDLGAMLKNNFMRLTIIPIPDPSGIVTPGHSRAELVYPNTTEAVPVDLIPGRPACFPDPGAGQAAAVIQGEIKQPIALTEDDKICQMIAEGKTNYAICQALDWKAGGSKYAKIEAIRAGNPGK